LPLSESKHSDVELPLPPLEVPPPPELGAGELEPEAE